MMARKATKATDNTTLYCSFCGKSQHEVSKLIAGPATFICDECVELCDDIIWDEHKDRIIIQIRLPDGVEFDDTLNDAFARIIDENFPGIDFKYECRRQYPELIKINKTTSSAVYSFSNNDKSTSDIDSLKEDIANVIRELSVTKTKFLTESKKRFSLEKELVSIKDEFLLYLRKDFSKSFGDGEHDLKVVMFLDVSGFSKFPLNEKEKVVDTLRGIALPIIGMKDVGHINMWGDAIVTTFDDPNKGIECAIKFVRHLAVEKLDIRIGMAWSEIRSAYNAALGRKDIDGPIVDFAARLEGMAEVGEILVSDEFGALDIITSAADIIPHKANVKKAFGEFSVGDEIDVFKVRITLN